MIELEKMLEGLEPMIDAEMTPDWVEPYAKEGSKIPVVTESEHPRFTQGTRFDYGFLQVSLRDGYSVLLKQAERTE